MAELLFSAQEAAEKKIVAESDRIFPEDSGWSPAFRRPASSPKDKIKALEKPVQLTKR